MRNILPKDVPDYVLKLIRINTAEFINAGWFPRNEQEDLRQILLLFYLENYDKFKPNVCSPQKLFVAFKNKLKDLVRHRRALMRKDSITQSFNELEEQGHQFYAAETLEQFENQLVVRELLQKLPSRERDICQMILAGATIEDIVKTFHLSYSTVPKIFKKIKKSFFAE